MFRYLYSDFLVIEGIRSLHVQLRVLSSFVWDGLWSSIGRLERDM